MSQNEADLARSSASIPSAFHTEIPTLKHRGWGTLATLHPNEVQQWYPLFAWRRQEKTKTSAWATRPSSLVPSGDPADGGYHSHPNDPNYYHERFSGQPGDYPGLGGDVGWAFSNNLPFGYPLSLGTPEGRLIIYYPAGNCQVFAKGSPVGTGTTIPICH